MTNKERIEEMASDLRKCVIQDYGGVYFLETAKKLYEQGYRKIPEGSVMLSKEEYERLKRVELEKDRLYEIKLDLENQLIQSGLTEYIGADEIEKQVRKETAKEILQEFKKWATEYQYKDTVIDENGERPMTSNEKLNYLYTYLLDKFGVKVEE